MDDPFLLLADIQSFLDYNEAVIELCEEFGHTISASEVNVFFDSGVTIPEIHRQLELMRRMDDHHR